MVNKQKIPIEVHVRSKGIKQNIFQKILRSGEYYVIPIDGKTKTHFYNKGIIDGRKNPIQLYEETEDFSRFHSYKWLIGIPKSKIQRYVTSDLKFTFKIGLSQTYLLHTHEIAVIEEKICPWCEECGLNGTYKCAEIHRGEFVVGSTRVGGTLGRWSYG